MKKKKHWAFEGHSSKICNLEGGGMLLEPLVVGGDGEGAVDELPGLVAVAEAVAEEQGVVAQGVYVVGLHLQRRHIHLLCRRHLSQSSTVSIRPTPRTLHPTSNTLHPIPQPSTLNPQPQNPQQAKQDLIVDGLEKRAVVDEGVNVHRINLRESFRAQGSGLRVEGVGGSGWV